MWIVEREHRREEDGNNVAIEMRESDGWMRANVRWDGCMQIWIETLTEEQNPIRDTIHTCDIRGLIDKLLALEVASEELFHYEGYWAIHEGQSGDDFAYHPDPTSRGGTAPPP